MYFPYDQSALRLSMKSGKYTDQTANSNYVGVYGPTGTYNVTILVNENTWTGLYAKDGSINVVQGAGRGVYSPCGALNDTIS